MSVTWGESEGLPKCLIIPLRKQHTATIFFLHGLGDSATGVKPFLQDLTEHPDLEYVRFVLPTAPIMPIIGMNGWSMYSWFDRYSFDHAKRKEDEKGQVQSAKWIDDLIKGRERSRQLGGLYALSTYVPCRRKVLEIATPQAKNLPILWCHGTADKQVNYDIWKDLAKTPAKQLYTLP